jgi:hypothetical protein
MNEYFFFYRILSFNGPTGQDISIFTGVFVIVWCGSAIVTINAKLLGGAVYVNVYIYVYLKKKKESFKLTL